MIRNTFQKVFQKGTQRVYVLPTLNSRFVFHAQFLKPETTGQRMLIVLGFTIRKYRYMVAEYFGRHWHEFGASNLGKSLVYRMGNRLTTRNCDDEHFLRAISSDSKQTEFIYPSSLKLYLAQEQLTKFIECTFSHYLTSYESTASGKHKMSTISWTIALPLLYVISKIDITPLLYLGNVIFTYSCYRCGLHFRSWRGAEHLSDQKSKRNLIFTSSDEFEDQIRSISKKVSEELADEQGVDVVNVWNYKPNSDLHDSVLLQLEKENLIYEIPRNYRRARLQQLVQIERHKT